MIAPHWPKAPAATIVMVLAAESAFYVDAVGNTFRLDHVDAEAETFCVTNEDTGRSFNIRAEEVSADCKFLRLQSTTVGDLLK